MLKGKEDARPTPNADAKPRKKLSFREPEIVGHMKQEIRKRLAGGAAAVLNNNQPPQPQQPAQPLVVERNNNRVFGRATFHPMGEIGEDPELESQAMRIVRTVGQAFEVCHKLSLNGPPKEEEQEVEDQLISIDNASDRDSIEASLDKALTKDVPHMVGDPVSCDTLAADSGVLTQFMDSPSDSAPTLSPSIVASPQTPPAPPICQQTAPTGLRLELAPQINNLTNSNRRSATVSGSGDESFGVAAQHELQMMREQLEQQNQQTHAAVAQVHLLRDQLAAETAARLEAQARTHQLLVHNKELLEHIQMLVVHLQDMERQQGCVAPQQQAPSSPRVTMVPQLTSHAKVDRWFQLRAESGFVDGTGDELAGEPVDLATAEALLKRHKRKKRRGKLSFRFGRSTF